MPQALDFYLWISRLKLQATYLFLWHIPMIISQLKTGVNICCIKFVNYIKKQYALALGHN